jgi:hypothetical protein
MPIGFDEIQVDTTPVGTIVTLKFREKLDKTDYDMFVPMLEAQILKSSPIRLLAELHDFKGWTTGALWEDTKFGTKYFNDIERLAIVGDSQWQKGISVFIKPFTAAKVRYFFMEEIDKARKWIRQE